MTVHFLNERCSAANRIYNARRRAVLHESCATHTSTLLKCWNDVVAQKRFIAYAIDGTGKKIRRTNLLEKEWRYDKRTYFFGMKRYWLMSERILRCPYSAILSVDISVDMEIGFICTEKCFRVFYFVYSDV
ncbi:hypothetical protein AVEN_106535-1 [Araneus ventricosus]|uniref:Uncharacterized protein n=1 Tax=Araneus ventricosus TaxID=182803 RepID=A0A4Y2G532_ARAVE|nr:hypothetical protein AVEN_106535-1 [Araneus ventricosus]